MRVLVLGATGLIGHRLWMGLSDRFDDVHALILGRAQTGIQAFSCA